MAPTIQDEDILVLNPDVTEPREGGAWIMVSDADDWAPGPVTGQDRIVGHVVWFGPEGAIVTEE